METHPDEDLSKTTAPEGGATLRRALGLWLLVLYGLGSIIGAGIYVLVGAVADAAHYGAPMAFLLAGVLAGLTGLSYAELSARFPEAAGAAVYVKEAFGSDGLSRLIGFLVLLVGVFLTASLARGVVGYIERFAEVPELPTALIIIAGFTLVACLGVGHSIRFAALMTLIEIVGLVLVIAAGAPSLARLPDIAVMMAPGDLAAWAGIGSGAFLAFFAFLGFEDIVNMAEETHAAERTLPKAIIVTILLSTLIYGAVALVAVTAVPMERLAGSRAPLELITEGAAWLPRGTLSAIALVAVPNGILITLVMMARILYGMARRGWVPGGLGHVNRVTRTPVRATFVIGGVVLLFTAAIGFVGLVTLTSAVNLFVFTVVNLALWKLHRSDTGKDLPIRVPHWCPPLAAASSVGLLAIHVFG
ncbi:MAG TPA: APC family permease [Alphaproteobacteria bacterium]|nr:APC family permease [Alphaproteobacteria bacterium]